MYAGHIDEFDAYVGRMIASGEVAVNDAAREMAAAVLQPRFPGVPRLALAPLSTITAGLLPDALREQYGLKWGRPERLAFAWCRALMPRLLPLAPPVVRYLPPARHAYRRVREWRISSAAAY